MAARVDSTGTLPGEISATRVGEKSAKFVVVKRLTERRAERRNEESRERGPNRAHGKRRVGGRKTRGVATAAATPCGIGRWGEWILIRVTRLSVESKRWREEARDAT